MFLQEFPREEKENLKENVPRGTRSPTEEWERPRSQGNQRLRDNV